MPSTYTTRNRAEKQAAGENSNTWGTRLNTNAIDMFDAALDGRTAFSLSGTKTLTTADGSADEARMRFIDVTGGTGGTVTIPNVEKWYLVRNGSSGDVIFTTGSGTTATVKSGNVHAIVSTGSNVVHAAKTTNFGSENLSTTGTLAAGNTTITGTLSTTGNVTLGDAVTDAHTINGDLTINETTRGLIIRDSAASGSSADPYIDFTGSDNVRLGAVGMGSASNSDLYIISDSGGVRVTSSTTASAANLYQAATNDVILRSTSSLRYKHNVETLDPAYNKALGLRPVWYQSLAEADNPAWGFWGLISEEVAEIDKRLVHFAYLDSDYEEVTTEVEVPVQATQLQTVSKPCVEVRDGQAVCFTVEEQVEVPLYDEFPLFDEAGNPVMQQTGERVVGERVVGEDENGEPIVEPITEPVYTQVVHRQPRMTTRIETRTERRLKAGAVKVPDGVQYERLSVLLLDIVQRQEARIAALEAKLI